MLVIASHGQTQKATTGISPSLCEIKYSPGEFLDKEVKIHSTYLNGVEMGWLEDNGKCDQRGSPAHTFKYIFDNELRKHTNRRTFSRFAALLKAKPKRDAVVNKITGKFLIRVERYKSATGPDKRFEYQIIITEVISIDAR